MNKDYFSRLSNLIYDSHIHMGIYNNNLYFSPEQIYRELSTLNIGRWAVSSTSTLNNNFSLVIDEFHKLIELSDNKIVPVLWLTPNMLSSATNILKYHNINFKALKIHGAINKWSEFELEQFFNLANITNRPVLIHTDESSYCDPDKYEKFFIKFDRTNCILAHGRPLKKAIRLANKYKNVYIDISFMSIENFKILVHKTDYSKILFGTDYPIEKFFYPKISSIEYYKNRVNQIISIIGEAKFLIIANKNFISLFDNIS